MSLIQPANFCSLTDFYASIYRQLLEVFDKDGGVRERAQDAMDFAIALNDYDQLHDMMESYKVCRDQLTADHILLSAAASAHNSLQTHLSRVGKTVDESIVSIESYADYWNYREEPDPVFKALIAEHFALFVKAVTGFEIDAQQCFPWILPSHQDPPGMGKLEQGTPDIFTPGIAYSTGSTEAKLRVAEDIYTTEPWTFKITGMNHVGAENVVWHATIAQEFPPAGTEVDITPDDGFSRLRAVTNIELESGTWDTGAVFVKPLQEREY